MVRVELAAFRNQERLTEHNQNRAVTGIFTSSQIHTFVSFQNSYVSWSIIYDI